MYIYFAQFMPAEDKPGAYCVDFPDLPGCSTFGDSLPEALANAKECLTSYLEVSVKEKEEISAPSTLAGVRKKAEQSCEELDINIPDETFYQAVQADALDEKPMQLSISMLPSLVRVIDDAAKESGLTRSGFLAVAARKYASELGAAM